ncbi:hypothetical protein EYZ11_006111 [Aspergillus tanneri]|uniref:Uncharacterized protein n=1 Tax=Aspergillus tanneri TaxID=1220188 RepID=A0A4V3UPA7_9EURO|nr:hypothetical protein EYZ11_006111 [Aspergillus tanneri]
MPASRVLDKVPLHMASDPHPPPLMENLCSSALAVAAGSLFFASGSKEERINRIGILEDNRRYHLAIGLGGLQVFSTYFISIRVRC